MLSVYPYDLSESLKKYDRRPPGEHSQVFTRDYIRDDNVYVWKEEYRPL